MSDELQQHGWDTTRALAQTGGSGAVLRELVTNVGAIANGDKDVFELIQKYGTKYYHFPSEEKMAKGIPSYTSTESIVSGASMIGVDNTNFNSLTGNTSLQAVLDEIDTFLTGGGGAPYLLQDGTTPLSGSWDVGGSYDIQNANSLSIYNKSLAAFKLHETNGLNALLDSSDSAYIGGKTSSSFYEVITNGNLSSAASWTFNGGWSFDTNHALYTDSGADGELVQSSVDLSADMINGMYYHLTYTVTNGITDSIALFTLSVNMLSGSSPLTLVTTDGTHHVYFKSDGSSFNINATGGSGAGTIEFDAISVIILDQSPVTVINNLTAVDGLTVDSRGISGGGNLEVIDDDTPVVKIYRKATSFSGGTTLTRLTMGGIEKAGQYAKDSYVDELHVQDTGWSSGDRGVYIVRESIRENENTSDEYQRITNNHDNQWWKGDTQNGVSSSTGKYKYRPVMGKIVTTGSAVTVKTIAIGTNEHWLIDVSGFGHIENGNQDEDFGEISNYNVYRNGGGAVTSNSTSIKAFNNGTAQLQLSTSGNNVLIQVVGVATETIIYLVNVIVQNLSLK